MIGLVFPLLNDAQRLRVGQQFVPGGNSETRQRYLDEDISLDEILMDRFEMMLRGIGGREASVVRATGFGDARSGLDALETVIGIESTLASFKDFKDAILGGPQSLEEATAMAADNVLSLADAYNGSMTSLKDLEGGVNSFRDAAAQTLIQIDAARKQISLGIGQTIFGLRLAQQSSPEGRFALLKGEFDRIASGIDSATSAQSLTADVNQLRGFIPQLLAEAQASGLSGSALDAFIEAQIATLESIEDTAQERLDELDQETINQVEAVADAIGGRFDEIAEQDSETTEAFGGHVTRLGKSVQQLEQIFGRGVNVAPAKNNQPNPVGA